MVIGRLLSYWEGNISGAMLSFGRGNIHRAEHSSSSSLEFIRRRGPVIGGSPVFGATKNVFRGRVPLG